MSHLQEQLAKIVENFQREERAILSNDRVGMRKVLLERRELLEGIPHDDSPSDSHLIEKWITEIDRCNKKNKLLLQMRLAKISHR